MPKTRCKRWVKENSTFPRREGKFTPKPPLPVGILWIVPKHLVSSDGELLHRIIRKIFRNASLNLFACESCCSDDTPLRDNVRLEIRQAFSIFSNFSDDQIQKPAFLSDDEAA